LVAWTSWPQAVFFPWLSAFRSGSASPQCSFRGVGTLIGRRRFASIPPCESAQEHGGAVGVCAGCPPVPGSRRTAVAFRRPRETGLAWPDRLSLDASRTSNIRSSAGKITALRQSINGVIPVELSFPWHAGARWSAHRVWHEIACPMGAAQVVAGPTS
jgi:hypothetical protein